MKKAILIGIFLYSTLLRAQQQPVEQLTEQTVIRMPVYAKTPNPGGFVVRIPCAYGQAALQEADTAVNWQQVQVLAVDLVFTDHPGYAALKKLNSERLRNLFAKIPSLAGDSNIVWQVVRQMDGALKAAAQPMFHGFVVYGRHLQSPAVAIAEAEKLKELLTPKAVTVRKKRRGFVVPDTTELRKLYEIEDYIFSGKKPAPAALAYLGLTLKEQDKYRRYDSLFVYERPETDTLETRLVRQPPEDSTVLKVLNRLPWQKMLVVTDVTASMYPYTAQLLLWLRLNEDERRIQQFVFFNDGDNREEDQKPIGRAGGIYTTSSSVADEVEKLLYTTMTKGSGGAIPENNIEALLAGLAACTDCGDVVMIADNWSAVRDMELLSRIKVPVHVIVCGAARGIHTDYLNIARQTGGSVHTVEKDISGLLTLREGDTILIGGYTYRIANGRFELVK